MMLYIFGTANDRSFLFTKAPKPEECKEKEKALLENNGNTSRPIYKISSLKDSFAELISFVVALKTLYN